MRDPVAALSGRMKRRLNLALRDGSLDSRAARRADCRSPSGSTRSHSFDTVRRAAAAGAESSIALTIWKVSASQPRPANR